MTETDARRLDPRYDPRFQRGYVGDQRSDAAADPPTTAALVHAAPEPTPPAPGATKPVPESAQPTPEATQSAPQTPEATQSAPDSSEASDPLADLEHDDSNASGSDGIGAAAPDDSRRPDVWFLGAWVVALAALVIGALLFWGGIMAQDYFGPSDQSDRMLQLAGWTVGPALMQVGLLGVVGLLGWAGVRHARRSGRQPDTAGEGP
jgi:hypothetical protein